MRRLLALAVAVAMVGGALFLRDRLDDGGGNGDDGASGSDGRTVLVCVTELASTCEALGDEDDLDVTVEPAGVTASALLDGDTAPFDAWLTLAPWPEIVEGARGRVGLEAIIEDAGGPLGRSPLVIVGRARVGLLEQACEGTLDWACVGRHAGTAWAEVAPDPESPQPGQVTPSFDPVRTSGTGLLVLGAAVSDYFGDRPVDLNDDAFITWLSRLERAALDVRTSAPSLVHHLVQRPDFDLTGGIEVIAGPVVESARGQQQRLRIYPSGMTADVVLAVPRGDDSPLDDGDVRSALEDAGWRIDDSNLPETNGLPRADVLEALWEQRR